MAYHAVGAPPAADSSEVVRLKLFAELQTKYFAFRSAYVKWVQDTAQDSADVNTYNNALARFDAIYVKAAAGDVASIQALQRTVSGMMGLMARYPSKDTSWQALGQTFNEFLVALPDQLAAISKKVESVLHWAVVGLVAAAVIYVATFVPRGRSKE